MSISSGHFKETWQTIDDSNVRHIWANPDGTGEITIDPTWYANNGTPVCDDNTDFPGEDMIYVRTEILA
jgi:hypothetical protein